MRKSKIVFILIFSFFLPNLNPFFSKFSYSQDSQESDTDIFGETPEWLKRVSFGLDIGTGQEPLIYLETVQPLYQDDFNQHTFFIQPRFNYRNNHGAYNLGLGYRRLFDDNSILLGLNTFFDYEDFHQHYRTGVGGEAFINLIECRFNTYIGLSPTRTIKDEIVNKEYEKAVDGIDWEFGFPIPYMNWIKLYGGGYWYDYKKFDNKLGWKTRTEIKPFSFAAINFIISDDNKGDIEYRVDGRVSIPLGKGGEEAKDSEEEEKICNIGFSPRAYPAEKADHSERVLDRVEREYEIEVEKWASSGGIIIEIIRGD
ncbi:MAG: inverse autotransporter beta domain-containing protein [Candidatus Omnitrophota bacterium]